MSIHYIGTGLSSRWWYWYLIVLLAVCLGLANSRGTLDTRGSSYWWQRLISTLSCVVTICCVPFVILGKMNHANSAQYCVYHADGCYMLFHKANHSWVFRCVHMGLVELSTWKVKPKKKRYLSRKEKQNKTTLMFPPERVIH